MAKKKLFCIPILLFLMFGICFNYQIKLVISLEKNTFERSYGGEGSEIAHSVIETIDGGFVVAGLSSSFGAGDNDIWLFKTDSTGVIVWNETFGGSEEEIAYSVIETNDGGLVVAGFTSSYGLYNSEDIWLIKTDRTGNMIWNHTFGGSEEEIAYSVIETSDGGFAIAGHTSSSPMSGRDIWLIKTDNVGNILWKQIYGGFGDEMAYSVIETNESEFIIAGYTTSYGAGNHDMWLIKTDNTGNRIWDCTFGGELRDEALTIIKTTDGEFVCVGYSHNTPPDNSGLPASKISIIKIDNNGSILWNKKYGERWDLGYSVIQCSDGDFLLSGERNYGGFTDILIIKTDSSGDSVWTKTYGKSNVFENGLSLIETIDGGFLVAGSAQRSTTDPFDIILIKEFYPIRSVKTDPLSEIIFFGIRFFLFILLLVGIFVSQRSFKTRK